MNNNISKKIIITIVVVIVLLAVIVGLFLFKNGNNTGETDPTIATSDLTQSTDTPPNHSDEVPMIDPGEKVHGIPSYLFDKGANANIKYEIENKNGVVFKISDHATLSDMPGEFDLEALLFEETLDRKIEPNKTDAQLMLSASNSDNSFVFGFINNSNTEKPLPETKIVYVKYDGNSDWSLCGVNTGMTKEDVVKTLGEPTQEYDAFDGPAVEYYQLIDGHSYVLAVSFHKETNKMIQIELMVDNTPILVED